ncbi:hypothetical protein FDP41_010395 [Naegleria fowleri]|uniref:Endonuclease/exonuclease/phosphatase domain-containing protein n=1 Tax=Naegleria fowleri TaxID=5763 RepID=A0A6A5CCJ1_NAEFO|nr:uncharacterized protein FDP41_010395 [Naegleria fowleri]KAF0983330.1 hypothetical protein FDP41_010395 [Naegleria fowleri]
MGNSNSAQQLPQRSISFLEEKDIIKVTFEFHTPIVGVDMAPTLYIKNLGTCIIEWFRETNSDPTKTYKKEETSSISLYNGLSYVPTSDDLNYRLRLRVVLFDDEFYLKTGKCFCKDIITKPVIQMPTSIPRRTIVSNMDDNILDYRQKTRLLLTYYKPDFVFSIGSYTLTYRGIKSHTLPDLDFISYSVYRKRLIYRELIQSDIDMLSLQNVELTEYNDWNLDLSKIGYSNISHILDTTNSGNCIFYKRSKFSRFSDTKIIELEYDDTVFKTVQQTISNFGESPNEEVDVTRLKRLCEAQQEKIRKNTLPSLCSIAEFEMKDNAELLKVFNHELLEDRKSTRLRPQILFDQLNVLVINFALHSLSDVDETIQLEKNFDLETNFLLTQLVAIFKCFTNYIATRIQQQPKLRLGMTLCGNIGVNNKDTILHKFITSRFGFTSPYRVITGDEFNFISNYTHGSLYSSNLIYFSCDHFQPISIVSSSVQVAQESIIPQQDSEVQLSFPNETFVCDEPMLKCEIQWIDPYVQPEPKNDKI